MKKPNFPLGKVFNKGLEEDDKKKRLLKRLKNVENKNKEQLTKIKDQGQKQLKILVSKMNKEVDFKKISFKNKLNFELTKLYNDIKKIDYKTCLHWLR